MRILYANNSRTGWAWLTTCLICWILAGTGSANAAPGPFDWSWNVISNGTPWPIIEVSMIPTGSVQCYALTVKYPALLTASDVSDSGVADVQDVVVRWGAFTNGVAQTQTVSFALTGKPGTNYLPTFSASWDGEVVHGSSTVPVHVAAQPVMPRVPDPVFDPPSGSRAPASVSISNAEAGVTIYYTTNGTRPSISSAVYSTPIVLSDAAVIRAVAYKADMIESFTVAARYDRPAKGGATRLIERSPSIAPYVSVDVSLEAGVQCYAYEEYVPPGLRVSGISGSGRWDTVTGVVRWGPYHDNQARAFSYAVVGQRGVYEVDGRLSVDGELVRSTGAHSLETEANFDEVGFFLRIPDDDIYFHGVKTLSWAGFSAEWGDVTADVVANRDGLQHVLDRNVSINDEMQIDTTELNDGVYEFRIIFRDAFGIVLGELTHRAIVNNSVSWHGGVISSNETWGTGVVHVVEEDIEIPSGVTVTLAPGATVKYASGVGIAVLDGGALSASGSSGNPIIMTSLRDDDVGGDTNMDGPDSIPRPGDWNGVTTFGSGVFSRNDDTLMYYLKASQGGTLGDDEIWMSTFVYEVTSSITIPAGITLTIQPGTIIKMHPGTQIYVGTDGVLDAVGTTAQPIIFTSLADDSAAGDTNADGDNTGPAAGDWRGIYASNGRVTLANCRLRYGGYSGSAAVYGTGGNTSLDMDSCLIECMQDEGVYLYAGTGSVVNCIIREVDEALYMAGGEALLLNGTIVSNRVGIWQSNGELEVRNMILADNTNYGVHYSSGTLEFEFNNVWHSGTADFEGMSSPVGTGGNLGVDPRFRSMASGNYRLAYQSPMIDAGSSNAPLMDYMGAPRYDDPRVANTGLALTNGAVPDMGAFEFVETASSDVDFVGVDIKGHAAMTSGEYVTLNWSVLNRGAGLAEGSWHDEILLIRDGATGGVDVVRAAEILSSGTVGSGQSVPFSACVRVPGGVEGLWRWAVHVNVQGEIFEGSGWTNNQASASSVSMLGIPDVPLDGTSIAGDFTVDSRQHWYRVVPVEGQDIEISLLAGNQDCGVEMYIGRGFMPTPRTFDIRQTEWNESTAVALIPWESTEPCYILVQAARLPAEGSAFSLYGRDMLFGLESGPASVVGHGVGVLLHLGGWRLSDQVVYSIENETGGSVEGSIYSTDSSEAHVMFDTSILGVGTYDLVARLGGVAVTQEDAVVVRQLVPGSVTVNLIVPGATRPGRRFTAYLEYENIGNVAAPAPFVMIDATNALILENEIRMDGTDVPIALTGENRESETVSVMCLSPSGPAGVLSAGAKGRIAIPCRALTGITEVFLHLRSSIDRDNLVDWDGLETILQPPFISETAWAVVYDIFKDRLGVTYGELIDALALDASYFSRFGERVCNVNNLLSFELAQSSLLDVSRRYAAGSFGSARFAPWDLCVRTNVSGDAVVSYIGLPGRTFLRQANGSFSGAAGEFADFTVQPDGYMLVERNGGKTRFNAAGSVTWWEDRNSNRVTCVYDGERVTRLSCSRGDFIGFGYNAYGTVCAVTDEVGRVTYYDYDGSGEHLQRVRSSGGTSVFTYVSGQGAAREHALAAVVGFNGVTNLYTYDQWGRLTNWIQGTERAHDSIEYLEGARVRCWAADDSFTTVDHDQYGHVLRVRDELGRDIDFAYNADFQTDAVLVPGGFETRIDYNDDGFLSAWVDAAGNRMSAWVDPQTAQITAIQDARGQTLGLQYDAHGNRTAIVYPGGDTIRSMYNTQGDITGRVMAAGAEIGYVYDAAGLLLEKHLPATQIHYTYDAHRNLIQVHDDIQTNRLYYDAADRLTNVVYSAGRSLSFNYDAAGRRTRITSADGYDIRYVYNVDGDLAEVKEGSGDLLVRYTYDANGRVIFEQNGNGSSISNRYDASGQLIERVCSDAYDVICDALEYDYSDRGLPESMTSLAGDGAFSYSARGELTRVVDPSGRTIEYAYDAAGNRMHVSDDGVECDYVANVDNQYTRIGDAVLEYDADGNLASRSVGTQQWSYVYDVESRITEIDGPDGLIEIEYDLLGGVHAVTRAGVRTEFLVDPEGMGQIVGTYNAGGQARTYCTYGMGLAAVEDVTSSEQQYFAYDIAGNPRCLLDDSGVVRSCAFLPFGECLGDSGGDVVGVHGFMARFGVLQLDEKHYLTRTRLYAADLGRFVQRDPVDLVGRQLNVYTYARNCPLMLVDPVGLWTVEVGVKFGVGAGGGGGGSASLVWDGSSWMPKGKLTGNGGGVGGAGVGLDLYGGYTTAPNADALKGWGGYGGMSGGAGPHGSLDMVAGDGYAGVEVGAGGGFAAEGHGGASYSDVFDIPPALLSLPNAAAYLAPPLLDLAKKLGQAAGGWMKDLLERIRAFYSFDPNDILGPGGYGPEAWIATDQILPYTIRYENYSNATAAAQTITITNQLDADLDWSTFQLDAFAIGTNRYEVPSGLQSYHSRVDLRERIGLYVDFNANLNPETGEVIWEFVAIDPVTGKLTEDPLAGFLPPNTNPPCGEGYVSYMIEGKTNASSGAEITALAEIVFDVNEAILTPQITNTIDAAAPVSAVNVLAPRSAKTFSVEWAADDAAHSGVQLCDIYVARENGSFVKWVSVSNSNTQVFTGEPGVQYSFFSVAHDHVGNVESAPVEADALTRTAFAATGDRADVQQDHAVFRWESATNMTYDILVSTNLTDGFTLIDNVPSTPPENVYTGSMSGTSMNYYRIKVVP